MLYPLKFQPIYQDYLWGGRNLAKLGKEIPEGKVAESWEISCHPKGVNLVANGVWAGTPLTELISELGEKLLGTELYQARVSSFPLMVKLIDANERLSVQVHPDDQYALQCESGELGKNEMWYILDANPDAELVYGLRPGVTEEIFIQALATGEIEQCLNYVPVAPGDVFEIPAGLVHAIGAGILLVEIQQNSNLTYRIFDYNRIDQGGNPRELHLEKALQVIDFRANDQHRSGGLGLNVEKKTLVSNTYFTVELEQINNEMIEKTDGSRFFIYVILEGTGTIWANEQLTTVTKGESILIPAGLGEYCWRGDFQTLKAYLPRN